MKRFFLVLAPILLLLAFWQLVTAAQVYPQFILPSPASVFERGQIALENQLWDHIAITLYETLTGFALSALLAISLAYLASIFTDFKILISPYLLGLQAVPTLAIAPLLVIWFGTGITTKIIIAGLICFLPIFISSLEAFAGIDKTLRMDIQALGAGRWQFFAKLELPAALPGIFNGLTTGISLALMGAVVGEFLGAQRGLGFLINLGRGLLDTPLVFVTLSVLIALGLGLFAAMLLLKRLVLSLR